MRADKPKWEVGSSFSLKKRGFVSTTAAGMSRGTPSQSPLLCTKTSPFITKKRYRKRHLGLDYKTLLLEFEHGITAVRICVLVQERCGIAQMEFGLLM